MELSSLAGTLGGLSQIAAGALGGEPPRGSAGAPRGRAVAVPDTRRRRLPDRPRPDRRRPAARAWSG